MATLFPIPEDLENPLEGVSWDDAEAIESVGESLLHTAAAIGAGVATRRGLQAAWRRWRGADPPSDPAARGVTWTDALLWAAAVGATVGVARLLSQRGAASAVKRYRNRRRR